MARYLTLLAVAETGSQSAMRRILLETEQTVIFLLEGGEPKPELKSW